MGPGPRGIKWGGKLEQFFEADQVDVSDRNIESIRCRVSHDQTAAAIGDPGKGPANLGDVALKGSGGMGREAVPPPFMDEPVLRYGTTEGRDQQLDELLGFAPSEVFGSEFDGARPDGN
ncbi:MAG: hypothetical protein NVS1B3_12690 [Candidatus Dormibacteraceae bacterium]